MSRAVIITIILMFVFASCTTAPVKPDKEIKEPKVPLEQAKAESLSLFNEILNLPEVAGDREAVLLEKEKLYIRIISEYSEVPLAQESYWRLIMLYVDDYSPPLYEKAESLYLEFIRIYPQSSLKGLIMETLSKSYYKTLEWDRLLSLTGTVFREFTQEGKRPRPLLLFMYAEANYKLGKFPEAEEGFKAMIDLFPNSGKTAKARLKEISKK